MRALVIAVLLFIPAAALAQPAPARSPKELRQICADAMNADPTFATDIVKTVNEETAAERIKTGDRIATDEKHVILAYGAMWVIAAAFVIFLWTRQRGLRDEIARLRRDLAAAVQAEPREGAK